MIRPLIDENEIGRAYAIFARNTTRGGEQVNCVIGSQSGSETVQLTWHAEQKLWIFLEPKRQDNRFWCTFGMDDPTTDAAVSMTCEINPPRSGFNRLCAGLFIVDSTDTVYLAHSGKIGGGRAGVGKTAFMNSRNKNDIVPVQFPDKKEADYIVIGGISDGDFLAELAAFVHAVAEFKRETALG